MTRRVCQGGTGVSNHQLHDGKVETLAVLLKYVLLVKSTLLDLLLLLSLKRCNRPLIDLGVSGFRHSVTFGKTSFGLSLTWVVESTSWCGGKMYQAFD